MYEYRRRDRRPEKNLPIFSPKEVGELPQGQARFGNAPAASRDSSAMPLNVNQAVQIVLAYRTHRIRNFLSENTGLVIHAH